MFFASFNRQIATRIAFSVYNDNYFLFCSYFFFFSISSSPPTIHWLVCALETPNRSMCLCFFCSRQFYIKRNVWINFECNIHRRRHCVRWNADFACSKLPSHHSRELAFCVCADKVVKASQIIAHIGHNTATNVKQHTIIVVAGFFSFVCHCTNYRFYKLLYRDAAKHSTVEGKLFHIRTEWTDGAELLNWHENYVQIRTTCVRSRIYIWIERDFVLC